MDKEQINKISILDKKEAENIVTNTLTDLYEQSNSKDFDIPLLELVIRNAFGMGVTWAKCQKENLNEVDLMKHNFVFRLRSWLFNQNSKHPITVTQIVERVYKTAPKTILNDRNLIIDVVDLLWRVINSRSIMKDEKLTKELDDQMDFHFYNII